MIPMTFTLYPPVVIQAAFAVLANENGMQRSGIAEAYCLRTGIVLTLNWDENVKRWFALAYNREWGAYPIVYFIGPEAGRPC